VIASGSFTHTTSTGALVHRGVWVATGFDSFVAFGGPSPGFQGGVLEITATLFPVGEAPVAGVPIKVTCLINAPGGFTGDEGTTVGPFTEQTGGMTFFHLNS
jgi:hypothetical protein